VGRNARQLPSLCPPCWLAHGGAILARGPASSLIRDLQLRSDLVHASSATGAAWKFSRADAVRVSLFSERCETSRRSRVFSSYVALSRLTFSFLLPPYSNRQRK
jgi:hypothetical protein